MSESTVLLGKGTWIQPGPATLVVRDAGWALLVPGLKKEVVEAAWTTLGSEPTAEGFLDSLIESAGLESLEKLPAILYALVDGTTAHIGVKGKTPLVVYTPEGSRQIAGTDDTPVARETIDGVRRIAFGDLPPEEPTGGLRLGQGVCRVRGFVHAIVDPADLDDEARDALAEQVEKDGRSIADPEEKKRQAERPKPPSPKPRSTASTPPPRPKMATRAPGAMPTSRAPAPPEEPSGPSVFDDLFGDTPKDDPTPPQPQAPTTAATGAPDPSSSAVQSAPSADAPVPTAAPVPALEPSPPAAPQPGPAPVAASPAPPPTVTGKRRLVSTSLFDRKRRPAPVTEQAVEPAPVAPAPEASPAPAEEPAPSQPMQESAPSPSVPTPPAPDENGDSPVTLVAPIEEESPVTLIAPVDDEDATESADASADDDASGAAPAGTAPDDAGARADGDAPSGARNDPETAGPYDDLFGKTVFRSIEDAAVRRTEEDEHAEESADAGRNEGEHEPAADGSEDEATGTEPDAPETLAQPERATADAASSAIGEDFIDWVPGVGREAPEIAQVAARRASQLPPEQAPYPQVQMAQRPPAPVTGPPMRAASAPHPVAPAGPPPMPAPAPAPVHPERRDPGQAGQGPSGAAPRGPSAAPPAAPAARAVALPGSLCPNGHPNSPERTNCRICRGPLEPRTRTVQRPPLGIVDISTGGGFLLDRSAIIGRRPRASRVSADDVPQLITVPSPQQDISRSHLELRLEGWRVIAVDLGTTNGTTLERPGSEPVRLRPGDGVVLTDGDRLDLGDGVQLVMRGMA